MSSQVSITLKAIDAASAPIGQVSKSLGMLKYAVVGIGAGLTKEFIDVNSQIEQMKVKLAGLFDGNIKLGEDALKWVREFQAANPVRTVDAMTEAFFNLTNAGIKPTQEAMKALIGGSTKYGLTEADLKRVLVAMRQITGVTNAQKQELNQLAEKIPQITNQLAKELGYKSPELFLRAMKRMEVDAKAMATAVVRILGKGADEAVENYSKTWEGGMVRLKTAWFDFMESLNSGGLFDKMKGWLDGISAGIRKLSNYSKELGVEFDYLVQAAVDFGNAIGKGLVEAHNGMARLVGTVSKTDSPFAAFMVFINDAIAGFRLLGAAIYTELAIAADAFFLFRDKVASAWRQVKGLFIKDEEDKNKEVLKQELTNLQKELSVMREELFKEDAMKVGNVVDDGGHPLWNEEKREAIVKDIADMVEKITTLQNALRDPASVTFSDIINKRVAEMKKKVIEIQGVQTKANEAVYAVFNKQRDDGTRKKKEVDYSKELEDALDAKVLLDAQVKLESIPKNFGESWRATMIKMQRDFEQTFEDIVAIGAFAAKTMTDAFTSGFELMFRQLKEGVINLKDIMMNILNSIYDAIAKILAQKMAIQLISQVGTMIGSAAPANGPTMTPNLSGAQQGPVQSTGMFKASPSQSVQIINNSGQELQVTQARSKGTVDGQIMTVVIDHVMNNKGGSRDMLKGALA